MLGSIKQFFSNLDRFLTSAQQYFDNRILTGKFISDISKINLLTKIYVTEKVKIFWSKYKKTKNYQLLTATFRSIYIFLKKIPFFAEGFPMLFDAFHIIKGFSNALFALVLFTLIGLLFILFFFNRALVLFFIIAPLIVLFTLFGALMTYTIFEKRDKGIKTNFLNELKNGFGSFLSFTFLFFYHCFISLNLVILFFLFAFFLYSTFIDVPIPTWGTSFFYWLVLILLSIVLAFCLFVFSVIAWFAYYYVIFTKAKTFESLTRSWSYIKIYFVEICGYSLTLFLVTLPSFIWLIFYYREIGIGFSIFILLHEMLFLGWLFRRHFIDKNTTAATTRPHTSRVFHIIFGAGVINYLLLTSVLIRLGPQLLETMQRLREQVIMTSDVTPYTNTELGYSIKYPDSWTLYSWDKKSQSITIYNNDTKTRIGGIWVIIQVLPTNKSNFETLFRREPGLVLYDTGTKDILSKNTNLMIAGYDTVKYTFIKDSKPYPEYQTHYLIKKGLLSYDIMFKVNSKEIEDKNKFLFEKIVNSFTFLEEK